MRFSILPRPKRVVEKEGTWQFDTLRIFTVGEGESFARTLRALNPAVKTTAAPREACNVVLSVAKVFSSREERIFFTLLISFAASFSFFRIFPI